MVAESDISGICREAAITALTHGRPLMCDYAALTTTTRSGSRSTVTVRVSAATRTKRDSAVTRTIRVFEVFAIPVLIRLEGD